MAALARHSRTIPDEIYKQALKDQRSRAWNAAGQDLTAKARLVVGTFAAVWRSVPALLISLYKSSDQMPSARTIKPVIDTGVAAGPWLRSLAAYFKAIMRKPKTVDFVAVFEVLEKIAQLQRNPSLWERIGLKYVAEAKPPIVIIREIQRLDNMKQDEALGRQVFDRLFEYFEPRKQGQSRVPIIFETSDCLWGRLNQIISSHETYLALQMGPWQKGEAKDWLVRRILEGQLAPIFSEEEFNKVI